MLIKFTLVYLLFAGVCTQHDVFNYKELRTKKVNRGDYGP
jgi:hypothetical protein